MPTITFVRHGQSESNAGLRTDHPGTSHLTALGQEQANLTALSFQYTPGLIVTSSYIRTQLTAEPLIQRFPEVPQLEWPVHEFTYLHPGNWKGTTWPERKVVAQAYWERLEPAYRDGEGAETWLELIARVDQVRQLILAQKAENVVIFSHGLFTRSLWWRLALPQTPLDTEGMRHYSHFIRGISIPNCAKLKIQIDENETWIAPLDYEHLPADLFSQ